jgi:hypothetical protein
LGKRGIPSLYSEGITSVEITFNRCKYVFSKRVFSFLSCFEAIIIFVVSKAFDSEDLQSLKKRGENRKAI